MFNFLKRQFRWRGWPIFALIIYLTIFLLGIAFVEDIKLPFLRKVVEALVGTGIAEPVAVLLALLIAYLAGSVRRGKDIEDVERQRDKNQVRFQWMLTFHCEAANQRSAYDELIIRDIGITWLDKIIRNLTAYDYVCQEMDQATYASPALILDGKVGTFASNSLVPFTLQAIGSGVGEPEWCVIFPGCWEDDDDIDYLIMAVVPEKELRKYRDREYCYCMLVESPGHAARVLFMRNAALLHFESAKSPFWRREVIVNRKWSPARDAFRPNFSKPCLHKAMVELGMLPSSGVSCSEA